MKKNIKVAILIIVINTVCSCESSPEKITVSRIISNKTDKSLTLNVYFGQDIVETIFIESESADTTLAKCYTDERGSLSVCPLSWHDMDSIRITFNDLNYLRYCRDFTLNDCNVNDKNIMILSSNQGYEFQKGRIYTFTITNECS